MALDGATGHPNEAANLTVCHIQNTVQNQNALLLFRQAGKGVGHKLIVDQQVITVRRKNVAVTGVMIYRGELVQFLLRQSVQRFFTVPLPRLLPQIILGLIPQNRLAKSVKAVLSAIITGDSFHLLTPFLLGD